MHSSVGKRPEEGTHSSHLISHTKIKWPKSKEIGQHARVHTITLRMRVSARVTTTTAMLMSLSYRVFFLLLVDVGVPLVMTDPPHKVM